MLPDFAIIGAQKSATTFLQRCLQAHPEVFVPAGELADFEDPQYAHFEIDQFQQHFVPGQDAAAVGLKRPSYLHGPNVPERLAHHLPDLKLIVVLRDPIERAISAYFHQMRHSFAPVRDVNTGLRAILHGGWEETYPRTRQIIEYGFYYEQLTRYLQHFDQYQFFVTTYQSIKETPQATVRAISEFLGVSKEADITDVLENGKANKGLYSKLRLSWTRLTNPIQFEYFHGGQRLRPRENIGRLGRAFIRFVRGIDRRLLRPIVTNKRPSLNPDVEAELVRHYRSDAKALKEEFDLDIEHWSVFA
ncbi:hypothetical protein GGQ21_003090 [Salinibacter ruber]|uniref:sulfotransferase family protein n=1 Tax=Salinibacter ruber TaxID=146919 RepID=UPI00216A0E33|nr:sulfotransferase [Salinibacter ruber]MCS3672420.1 hypothetical protein [Salinibacter ruber]